MKAIASRDNAAYKTLRRWADSTQASRRSGVAILEGVHLCQAYRAQVGVPREIWVREDALASLEALALLCDQARMYVIPSALMQAVESTEHGQGIIYVVDILNAPLPSVLQGSAVLLDRVQDPGNVGSILRTCAAAGVQTVLLGQGSASAWSTKVLRAGMGAHFAVDIVEDCDLHAIIPLLATPLIATSSYASQTVWAADLPKEAIWIFGHEGQGVAPSLLAQANLSVTIPLAQNTESLNVAAAVAICLFEQRRRYPT